MIKDILNTKTQETIDVDFFEIKEGVKSGANISKKSIIVNNNVVITKNHKVKYVCSSCGKEQAQMYQKCSHKLLSLEPLCSTCSRKKSQNITEETIKKRKETHLKRYGKYNNNNKKAKETKLKRYGDENYNNIEKTNKTKIVKYGNKNNFDKIIQTNLKKYGVENVYQAEEIKEKIKQTKLDKYGDEYYSNTEKIKQTNLERYGVKNVYQAEKIKEKIKQIVLDKYGVEYAFQADDVKEKIKQSLLKKYGVDNPALAEEIKEKIKQTNLERYGVEYGLQNEEIKQKSRKTFLKKYNVEHALQDEEFLKSFKINFRKSMFNRLLHSDRLKNKVIPLFEEKDYSGIEEQYLWKCNNCENKFYDNLEDGKIPRCLTCYPLRPAYSLAEKEIVNWLKSLDIIVEESNRSLLNGKEIDIYLPNYKLGIEFNGLYWHSELQGKSKEYHLNKTTLAEENNIELIHIFEDEWLNKEDVVKSIILSKLGLNKKIYARRCEIKEINDVEKFYEENHLQGHVYSKINIGLYYNNELVSCLSFSKPRFNRQYDWEITRYANRLNYSVVGGFAKLLKYFRKKYDGSIITYSDLRYFTGKIYENNGFTFLNKTNCNYYYTDYRDRFNRMKFQKHKLQNILEDFDPSLTEWENMQLSGYDRIWDCGNNAYLFK